MGNLLCEDILQLIPAPRGTIRVTLYGREVNFFIFLFCTYETSYKHKIGSRFHIIIPQQISARSVHDCVRARSKNLIFKVLN